MASPPETVSSTTFVPHVLGTAGHIDHGKSTLVEKLTGVHPDRLKEERERGLTIDLGYAPYRLPDGRILGIIDVPGHERFVRNMVAGATSVDLVLLVVAADDGVMPQTREHVEILRLLGVTRGIVALTKVDLVDEDLRALVEEDVRGLLRGTPLETAPILRVSSATGEGLDRLRSEIDRGLDALPPRSSRGAFRMPIQRVFSARGFGTVVTGVPVAGEVRIGDSVEILPAGASARVRGIQAYEIPVSGARAGHRLALNLTDVDYKRLQRGHVVAEPGAFAATTAVEVRLEYLASNPKALRKDLDVRLHVGTSEVVGRMRLLDPESIPPGGRGFAHLLLHEPLVAAAGDAFIVRLQSPLVTLGGGRILATGRKRAKRGAAAAARLLEWEAALGDPARLLEAFLRERSRDPVPAVEARRATGLPATEAEHVLAAAVREGVAVALGERGPYLHRDSFGAARDRVREAVRRHFERRPLDAFVDRLPLLEATGLTETTFEGAVAAEAHQGGIEALGRGRFRLPGRRVALSDRQAKLRETLLRAIEEGGFQPPSLDELIALHSAQNPAEAKSIAALLVAEGTLARIGEGLYLHAAALERAKDVVARAIRAHGDLPIPEVRDALQTSRKFLIPLLEHLDAIGFTARRAGKRMLREPGGPS